MLGKIHCPLVGNDKLLDKYVLSRVCWGLSEQLSGLDNTSQPVQSVPVPVLNNCTEKDRISAWQAPTWWLLGDVERL